MKPCTWTFRRADEQLVLQRQETDEGVMLIITAGDGVSKIPFRDPAALIAFQGDMETMLLHTGWSLQQFAPESRARDRRRFPRVTNDRRRWWTDPISAQPPSAAADPSKSRSRRRR